jgi:alcohol dehydrogenase
MLELTDVFNVFVPDTVFGFGAIGKIGEKVKALKCSKPLIVTDKGVSSAGLLDRIEEILAVEQIHYGIFSDCKPDAPFSSISRCVQVAIENNHDMLVAVGGGSVMDTTKLASTIITGKKDITDYVGMNKAETPGLPKIFIPTTSGTAAEWSHYVNITDDRQPDRTVKLAAGSIYFRPEAVIVDPTMTLELPAKITAETGIDTLSHGIEPFTTWKSNPLSDMVSSTCIALVAQNFRAAYGQGSRNQRARYNMSIAASLGFGFTISGGGAVHAMAYPLQMNAHISHGESIAIMLPGVMEFNIMADMPKFARVAELMGEQICDLPLKERGLRAVIAVRELIADVGLPQRIRDVRGEKDDFSSWVDTVFINSPHLINSNCRKITKQEALEIYESSW